MATTSSFLFLACPQLITTVLKGNHTEVRRKALFFEEILTHAEENTCMRREFWTDGFVSLNALLAIGCFIRAFSHWRSTETVHFVCYFIVALLASSLKVTLPGIEGTMSVSFVFVLLGTLELSLGETLVVGVAAVLVQSYWKLSKPLQPIQIVFNISHLTVAAAASYEAYHYLAHEMLKNEPVLALVLTALTYFAINTASMSLVISLAENKSARAVWADSYAWMFPCYLVGAGVAAFVHVLDRFVGWEASLVVFPAAYLIFRSYRLYLGRLENGKRHTEQAADLHLRTIEALALAIDAQDHTTHDHLQRVRVYAMELAKDMGLNNSEREALLAAALLHDIGKIAVPVHIISKPGKLTPEEFDKMKVHPVIGAEILKQVKFPYPVVPIVRGHHERWDGSGYPDGLKGEEIPIGARILAVVDCLDALASDRQYRRALPLDEAMAAVAAEAGISFDPNIVQLLERRYVELEKIAREKIAELARAPVNCRSMGQDVALVSSPARI
jgi:putative nucleotidyltransferase with HDIG domain